MMFSLLYVLLAVLGLSFLIFIHELGHYWMAKRVGMHVETFAIGFGKPLCTWVRDGTTWQVGWLPFGGYVKIAGTETQDEADLYNVPGGFFSKSPWARIKVAFMGPLVNLVFALVVFGALWSLGGREKGFSEFTSVIGWVDPHSELYAKGVRPGDEITSYDDVPFQGKKDHIYAPMTASSDIKVSGFKVDYATNSKTPFQYIVKTYPHPQSAKKDVLTAGILSSGNYIIYNKQPNGVDNPLPDGSPLKVSGIEYGDRVLWVDGEIIFSSQELDDVLNDSRALLTIKRGNEFLLRRVPRIRADELKLEASFKDELADWQYEAHLNSVKMASLYTIPYNLTNDAVVENDLKYIDKDKQEEAFTTHPFSAIDSPLLKGDKIVAVDGIPIEKSYELLKQIQQHRVNIIVQRNPKAIETIAYNAADEDFDHQIHWKNIQAIAQSIGTGHPVYQSGDLVLLKPIVPKMRADLILSPDKQAWFATEILEKKKEIAGIDDPEMRAQALRQLEYQEKQLLLGLPMVQDRKVHYNPMPLEMFKNVFEEIWRTLGALVSGSLNSKWLTGPIGIVHVVHDNWMVGAKEALFWLGAISLNLGILNLLPIPVLDGGTIVMNIVEIVTRRRIHPKTLEKVILPFAVLLILFFVFLTYNDIRQLFG